MNMRSYLLTFVIIVSHFALSAQPGPGESPRNPHARERIRAAHAAYLTERLELTPAEAEKFWPVYREYNEKRRGLRDQMREARNKGADEKALLDLDLRIKEQDLALEKEYTARFEKIISPEKVLKLHQAEADFRRMVLRQIEHRQRRRR